MSIMEKMMERMIGRMKPEKKEKMMEKMMPKMMEGMDMSDMMPAISEPLYQAFNARVEVKPVMVLEDVKKGIQALSK